MVTMAAEGQEVASMEKAASSAMDQVRKSLERLANFKLYP